MTSAATEPLAMSQTPSNWPPQQPQPTQPPPPAFQQPGQNPFSDQGQSPFGPQGPYPGYYGPPPTRIEDEPGMRWILPVGTSLWAIAAGYLGLGSIICFPAPLAIICSLIAIWHLRRNPRLSGWGRAIFGLAMGSVVTVGVVIAMILSATSR